MRLEALAIDPSGPCGRSDALSALRTKRLVEALAYLRELVCADGTPAACLREAREAAELLVEELLFFLRHFVALNAVMLVENDD